jgi:tetratricopeptide (TPR) repeat protein
VWHQWHEAKAALAADRPAEARDRLAVCLLVWPRDPEVHLLAARAARLSNDAQAAEDHLNQCLKLHGGATEAVQLEFLLLRVQTGEVDEVAPTLIDCVEKGHPESAIIMETMARAYIQTLRYKPAYACLTRWIEIRPEAKAYQWRGWVMERMDHHQTAADDYKRALELDPDLVPVRLRVAEMSLEDSDPQAALPHLERLRKQHPDRPEVLARLGQCRFLQGYLQEARQFLEAAVQKLPRDPLLLVHLAKLEIQEGRPAEAERWSRRALEVDPYDTEAEYTLFSSLQDQGRREEAAVALDRCEKHKALVLQANKLLKEEADHPTTDARAPSEAGAALLLIGQERLGEYWLHEAERRDPRHQPTLKALAEYYENKGESERAATYRRRLAEVEGKTVAP